MQILLVTPNSADSDLAAGFLDASGAEIVAVTTLAEAAPRICADTGCVVIVEEALVESEVNAFHEAMRTQPAWSEPMTRRMNSSWGCE